MKKYKGLIIFTIILVVYGIVMYLLFNESGNSILEEIRQESNNEPYDNNNYFLVINDTSILRYHNKRFSDVTKSFIENLDSLKVFVNNKYYGDYKLKYGATWNLFNNKDEYVEYDGNLLAYSPDFNIVVRDTNIRKLNDEDKNLLKNNFRIDIFDYLTTEEVIDIDLDNNATMDEIICLSSMEESDSINNYYSIVLVKLNGEVYKLIDERGENAFYVYNIISVINLLNNDYDSIILSKTEGYISESPLTSNLIYNYKNSNYVID